MLKLDSNYQGNSDLQDLRIYLPPLSGNGVKTVIILENIWLLDPECRDVYHCHPYHMLETCIPLHNKAIRLLLSTNRPT